MLRAAGKKRHMLWLHMQISFTVMMFWPLRPFSRLTIIVGHTGTGMLYRPHPLNVNSKMCDCG